MVPLPIQGRTIVPAYSPVAAVSMAAMFSSSEPVLVFDYLRIPYATRPDVGAPRGDGLAVIASDRFPERRLLWPQRDGVLHASSRETEAWFRGSPIFARVADDAAMSSILGPVWMASEAICDRHGTQIASIWRDPGGSICLPFDPAEAIIAFWSEDYLRVLDPGRQPGPGAMVRAYYRIRPIVPRWLQIAARRAYARHRSQRAFPRWPVEPAFHDLLGTLYRLATEIAGEAPPWIAPWPAPYSWALVLTHDVETSTGYERIGEISAAEHAYSYRSAWNFVPRRYPVDNAVLRLIARADGEVGVHGLHHDGRDLASRELLEARLPEMHAHAMRWGAVGFRSPATQRRWDLMPSLGFDYDSSYPQSDPYEPQPGGSCTWLPYMIGDLVELPITLPQDHTLFVILQNRGGNTWLDTTALLRSRGGMALLLTHPDYLHIEVARRAYRELLECYADDLTAWRPLPREVSAWWRRRAASSVVTDDSGWRVEGPAADEASVLRVPPA